MVMNVALQLNNIFDRLLKKISVLSFNPSEKEFFIFLFFPQEFGVSQPNFCINTIHILKQSIYLYFSMKTKHRGFKQVQRAL